MADFKRMYFRLFNAVTDALAQIDEQLPAAEILRRAQQDCEEMYIFDNEDELTLK